LNSWGRFRVRTLDGEVVVAFRILFSLVAEKDLLPSLTVLVAFVRLAFAWSGGPVPKMWVHTEPHSKIESFDFSKKKVESFVVLGALNYSTNHVCF